MLSPGTTVGGYRVDRLVRIDGESAVYSARHVTLDRVALLHITPAPGDELLARARALTRVEHPAVLPVYDVGTFDDIAYVATGVGTGVPLSRLDRRDDATASAMVDGALAALAAAGLPARAHPSAVTFDPKTQAAFIDPLGLAGGTSEPPVTPSPRHRRGLPAAITAGAVLAAVLGVWLLARDSEETPPRPQSTTPAATIDATIDVGGVPASVTYADGTVWTVTTDRRLVRVDPRREAVVGAPLRLGPKPRPQRPPNLTVRAGEDAVYIADSGRRTITRVDARTGQVAGERRFEGGPSGLLLVGDALWVGLETPAGSRVVRLDARSLRRSGPDVSVSFAPIDMEAVPGAILVLDPRAGTVRRIDTRTLATREVGVAVQPIDAAVVGERLWVPDPFSRSMHVLEPDLRRPATTVLALPARNVVALDGEAFVIAPDGLGPDVDSRLIRVDPGSARQIGAAVELGVVSAFPGVGGGAIWIAGGPRRALLKVIPRDPAPVLGRDLRVPRDDRVRPGVLRAGTVGSVPGAPFTVKPPDDGWIAEPAAPMFEAVRFEDPGTSISVMTPSQLVDQRGDVRRARSVAAVVEHLRRHRGLRVVAEGRTRVAGRPAVVLDIRVRASGPRLPFCPARCAPLFADGPSTELLQAPTWARVRILEHDRRPLTIVEYDGGDRRGWKVTGPLVASFDLPPA